MAYNYDALQTVAILNKVLMAYFQNIIWVNHGINLNKYKPVYPPIKDMVNRIYSPRIEANIAYMKTDYEGKVIFDSFDLKFLSHSRIEEFMNEETRKLMDDLAKDFADNLKKIPYCDMIFAALPDAAPLITACENDGETDFNARLIAGSNFGSSETKAVWEFYCLFMPRMRPTDNEENIMYGKEYKDVEFMTDEERLKFDKQPEKEKDE